MDVSTVKKNCFKTILARIISQRELDLFLFSVHRMPFMCTPKAELPQWLLPLRCDPALQFQGP